MRLSKLVAILACLPACQSSSNKPTTTDPAPVIAANPAHVIPASTKVTQVNTLFLASDEGPQRAPSKVDPEAPFSLTASDGSGLQVTRIDAKAVVEGPLAFTELHLYFHNAESRTREGTFAITLPEGAAVSRFAMETNGQLVEAEVVEKQLARRAYDDFLHRRQDPALLEKAAGNQFSAKVFPIPANADKHIVLSFSQEVSPGKYTMPLRGLSKADRVDVRVQVRGKDGDLLEQSFAQRDWVADRDIVVDASKLAAPTAIVAGDFAAARVTIATQQGVDAPTRGVTVLVDTSASRGLNFGETAKSVEAFVGEIAKQYGAATPVQVLAFDQTTQPIYDGTAGAATGIATALEKRGALGASDLGQALAFAAEHGAKPRVVVMTDGVVTAGDEADVLKAKIAKLQGIERIDVALAGGIRDSAAAQLVTRSLGKVGAVLDLDGGTAEVARRVGLTVRTELPVTVAGASWVFPKTIAAAQAGDEVTVYWKRGPQGAGMSVGIGGVETAMAPVGAEPALVERAIASAQITEMEAQVHALSGDAAKQLRAEIVKKSVASRVVSDETSMLVLENDSDYARYGIDRTALADILTIGPAGVSLATRRVQQVVQQPQIAVDPAKAGKTPEPKVERKMAPPIGKPVMPVDVPPQLTKVVRDEKEKTKDSDDGDLDKNEAVASARSQGVLGNTDLDDKKLAVENFAPGDAPAPSQGYAGGMSAGLGSSAPMAPPPPPAMTVAPSPTTPPMRVERQQHERMPMPDAQPIAARNYGTSEDYDNGDSNDDGMAANRHKASLTGELAAIESLVKDRQIDAALTRARAFHAKNPGDVLALIGLGDALEAQKDLDTAARVYGSIIDLFPARADFRRFAGERLERIGKQQRALIIDTYKRAVEERPDHLTGHRLLAYAYVQDGQFKEAFAAILAAIEQPYQPNQYAGGERVLAEDAGMIGAAYLAHGGDRAEIVAALGKHGTELAKGPSTRFIMYWETDANDVDFHIRDARGGHAWYSHKALRSGGELYADITTGYGPECFAIPGRPTAGPYELSINYFSQGPMGYGMGLLQIQKFDGKNIALEDRPYVIMVDQAFVDLGTYKP